MTDALPRSVNIGGNIFDFPWIDMVPRNSQETLDGIEESIKQNGILSPVMLYGDSDVIDGHTRLMLAAKLGIKIHEIPFAKFQGSREQAEEAVVAANASRRNWTREVRLATVETLFKLGWSQRRIAKSLGVGHSQVDYDLKHLGLIETPAPKAGPAMTAENGVAKFGHPARSEGRVNLPTPEDDATSGTDQETPPQNSVADAATGTNDADEPAIAVQGAAEVMEQSPAGAAPTPSPGAPAKPESSAAERHQANIDRGNELVRSLTKMFSAMGIYRNVETHLNELLKAIKAEESGPGKK